MTGPTRGHAVHGLSVFPAERFVAVDGANMGDCLGTADDLILGDAYVLLPGSEPSRLDTLPGTGLARLQVAPRTEAGRAGAALHLDCCATFMTADGTIVEVVVLTELAPNGTDVARVHLHPLAQLVARRELSLIAVDRAAAVTRCAEAACMAFTAGTRIALSSGQQKPIESLRPGERVLTRDHGPQPLRWIGRRTHRALGSFAPIRIARGALNNARDLIVSPQHRLLVYQRRDAAGAGRAELLVRAEYLLNGDTVTRTSGGFVDYVQLLFDRHEIVYAEGIAAETLRIDVRSRATLPEPLRDLPEGPPVDAVELPRGALPGGTAADLLRRASAC